MSWCLILLLVGCNSVNIRDIVAVVDDPSKATQVLKNKSRYYAINPQQLPADLKALKARVKEFVKQITRIWGEDNATQSGPKDYVKYTDKYYQSCPY